MCDMTACPSDATHFAVIGIEATPVRKAGTRRLELCGLHVDLAVSLAVADCTKLVEYGPLSASRFREMS